MSRSAALLGLFLLLAASPITAQTVVQPEKPLRPDQVELRDAMVKLRDTLNSVSSAGARLVRGVGTSSSPAWLRARARNIAAACTRSRTTMAEVRPAIEGRQGTGKPQLDARRKLLASMTELAGTLAACEGTWAPRSSASDTAPIRERGPSEVEALKQELQAFDLTLTAYASTEGIKLPPMGSGSPPEFR